MKSLESFQTFALNQEVENIVIGGELTPTSYSGADGNTGSDFYDTVNQRVVYLNQ